MADSSEYFKQKLVRIYKQFASYLENHNCKKIPIKDAVVIMQKQLSMSSTTMLQWLESSNNCSNNDTITWEQFLICLQQQLDLEDQVNKLGYHRESAMEISFYTHNLDLIIEGQKFTQIINYIKKKQTNIVSNVYCPQFLNFKLIAIVFDSEIMFYNTMINTSKTQQQKRKSRIMKCLKFNYNNVRAKMIKKRQIIQQKNNDSSKIQIFDKVNPINSRRTEDFLPNKDQKNQHYLDQFNRNNSRKNKLEQSVYSDYSQVKRSVTDSSKISRSVTGMNRWHKSQLKNVKSSMVKIRSNDNKTAFRIITQAPINNSIEFIKAFKSSHENFEKYITIEKNKIQKERNEEIVGPNSLDIKQNFDIKLNEMRKQSHLLSTNKVLAEGKFSRRAAKNKQNILSNSNRTNIQSLSQSNYIPRKKNKSKRISTSISEAEVPSSLSKTSTFSNYSFSQVDTNDACKQLEQKSLGIQSLSFCDNYLLVSLMNCEVRLYSFRTTIHGFSETLVFEQSYPAIIVHVLLYKSKTRQLYNMGLVKLCDDESSQIMIYQLDYNMRIQKQCFTVKFHSTPIFKNLMPIGMGGYAQNGYSLLLQLNCTTKKTNQLLSFQKYMIDQQTLQKFSLSSILLHPNLVDLYYGTKDGFIFIYDRCAHIIRTKNKVSKFPIKSIKALNNSNQLLFWDNGPRLGIINSSSLLVSHILPISSQSLNFKFLEPFFSDKQFLLIASRGMGIIKLQQNSQKEFIINKPIKMLQRRRRLNQPTNKTGTKIMKQQNKTRKINAKFICGKTMVLVCSDYQVMIFDKNLKYIGSYFTLKAQTIIQCIICSQKKFLGIIYENNEIQIINIYTQSLIMTYESKQQIDHLFFCGSSVYFCGFITKKTSTLYIFSFPNSRDSNTHNILYNKSIASIISTSFQEQSCLRSSQVNEKSCNIRFYRGTMAYINYLTGYITFLNKKTYTRCRMFYLLDEKYAQNKKNVSIVDIKQEQNGYLSIMRSDCQIFIFSFDKRQLEYQFNPFKNQQSHIVPFQHHYNRNNQTINIVYIKMQTQIHKNKLLYQTYEVKPKFQKPNVTEMEGYQIKLKSEVDFQQYWNGRYDQSSLEEQYQKLALIGENLIYFDADDTNLRGLYGPNINKISEVVINIKQF